MYKLPTLQPMDAMTLLRCKCAHALLFVGCANADSLSWPSQELQTSRHLGVPCDACHLLMTSFQTCLPFLPSSPAISLWPATTGSVRLPHSIDPRPAAGYPLNFIRKTPLSVSLIAMPTSEARDGRGTGSFRTWCKVDTW